MNACRQAGACFIGHWKLQPPKWNPVTRVKLRTKWHATENGQYIAKWEKHSNAKTITTVCLLLGMHSVLGCEELHGQCDSWLERVHGSVSNTEIIWLDAGERGQQEGWNARRPPSNFTARLYFQDTINFLGEWYLNDKSKSKESIFLFTVNHMITWLNRQYLFRHSARWIKRSFYSQPFEHFMVGVHLCPFLNNDLNHLRVAIFGSQETINFACHRHCLQHSVVDRKW